MQNLKKVLRVLEGLKRKCEELSGDEIEKAIPQDKEEAVKVLYEIGDGISFIFRTLSPLREMVVSKRIKLENQQKEKTH